MRRYCSIITRHRNFSFTADCAFRNGHGDVKKRIIKSGLCNIRQAISYKPNYALFHNTLAVIHLKRGNYDEAIKEAEKSIGLSEKHFNAPLAVKAEALRCKDNPGGSIIYWEKFLRYEPNNVSAHMALLELYDLKGKRKSLSRRSALSSTARQKI